MTTLGRDRIWSHRHRVTLSEGGLHLRQLFRVGGPGPVDHQEPTYRYSSYFRVVL